MSLGEEWSNYMREHPRLPCLSYHHLISLLHNCPFSDTASFSNAVTNTKVCKACDAPLFPLITKELNTALAFFNTQVRGLLHIHLSGGFKKAVLCLTHKEACSNLALLQKGQHLLDYASIITRAVRGILEEYDKVHRSSEGSNFRAWLFRSHMEIVQSPWLVELLALILNLRLSQHDTMPRTDDGCVCNLENGKPILACVLHESLKLEIEVACAICLETLFEPVALNCGHIFCFSCACAAASVRAFKGLRKAKRTARCPICRQTGAFIDAFRLTELHLLVKMRCKEYWKTRLLTEHKERMQQIRDHWSYKPEDVGTGVFLL